MITFVDGPAAGEALMLTRSPKFLRVVRDRRSGKWDALDKLDDAPRPWEEIFAYRLITPKPGVCFIDFRDKSGRRRGAMSAVAEYSFVTEQPSDAEMRTNQAWRDWATRAARTTRTREHDTRPDKTTDP